MTDPPLESDPSPASSVPPRRRRWKPWAAVAVLVPILVLVLYTAASLTWSYSDGERAGILQKLSHKGWLCKTWEGELAMTSVPGVAPTMWPFTVRDDAVARRVSEALGKRVVLHYEEHRGVPSQCFGETSFFVNGVSVVPQ